MKKLIASTMLGLAMMAGAGQQPCGWDFERAHKEGLPPTYCFDRQARGPNFFYGLLKPECSGSACSVPNHV